MSAGVFVRSFYEADDGEIHPIRVQPETIAANLGAANAAPAGPATSQISARVSGSERQLGLRARRVTVQFTGDAPEGYKPNGITSIPILTPAVFDAITAGSTGTYLGETVQVITVTDEVAK